ncbi:hypothetical protein M885DRAFT_558910 [Pelagophyceae sp. CCMP2097]|nr:hypothetical protein M885DRAFT_558910 [Pelagophyceae sp. CCMP2097]
MEGKTTRGKGIYDYTFGRNTSNITADFAAQVEHKFPGNLTCTAFNHSNCGVVVVALNPREIMGDDGKANSGFEDEALLLGGG